MFPKAQIAVSEVLGRQSFNIAEFCAIVACTKNKLKTAIFKTGGRPILWQEKFKDLRRSVSEGNIVFQRPNKLQVFLVVSCQNLDEEIQHINNFFAKQHPNVTLFSQKSHHGCLFISGVQFFTFNNPKMHTFHLLIVRGDTLQLLIVKCITYD